jgi:signal transduction histidine kinase
MRERAARIGGKVEIESEPGNGTTILVRVPHSVEDAKRKARHASIQQ